MNSQAPPSPTYRIFRDKHGIPQFEPKRGTQALKDALIYSFPTLDTELQLMQAALRKFFDSEKGSTFVFELPEKDLQTSLAKKADTSISYLQSSKASLRSWKVSRASRTPSRPSSRASSRAPSRASSRCETPTSFPDVTTAGGTMTTWLLSNGQELEKRKRQPYDPVKRRKVAENRGNACEKHRAAKTACNPEECPQNKLYGKTQRSRRESEASAYDTPADSSIIETMLDNSSITAPVSVRRPHLPIESFNNQDLDVFFDAIDLPEPINGAGTFHSDHPTTNSNSTSWTDNVEPEDLTWGNSSLLSSITDPITLAELPTSTQDAQVMEGILENPPLVLNEKSFGDFTTQELQVVPEEFHIPHEAQGTSTLEHVVANFNASDDPFMGWASKRASHLMDEYGWVLSHVEAL